MLVLSMLVLGWRWFGVFICLVGAGHAGVGYIGVGCNAGVYVCVGICVRCLLGVVLVLVFVLAFVFAVYVCAWGCAGVSARVVRSSSCDVPAITAVLCSLTGCALDWLCCAGCHGCDVFAHGLCARLTVLCWLSRLRCVRSRTVRSADCDVLAATTVLCSLTDCAVGWL